MQIIFGKNKIKCPLWEGLWCPFGQKHTNICPTVAWALTWDKLVQDQNKSAINFKNSSTSTFNFFEALVIQNTLIDVKLRHLFTIIYLSKLKTAQDVSEPDDSKLNFGLVKLSQALNGPFEPGLIPSL